MLRHSPNSLHGVDQAIDFIVRVVQRERRPHGGFYTETAKRWLCTVVPGTNRDAFLVQQPTNVFRAAVRQHEAQHTYFFAGRADEPQAIDFAKLFGRVLE